MRVAGLKKGRLEFEARLDDVALPTHLSALFGLNFSALDHAGFGIEQNGNGFDVLLERIVDGKETNFNS